MTSKISIALATYNGSRYLPDLLNSLLVQVQLPAELIVCDDASDDETVCILESFSRTAPFPVKVFPNDVRVGVTQNFSRAISLCTSDFIALADQDDVWLPKKLQQLSQAFSASDSVAVFSDADVVGENLHPLGYTMWDRVSFAEREQSLAKNGRLIDVLLKHRVVTGATLCFRRSLVGVLLPIPSRWPHDAWIAIVAAAVGGVYPINQSLIYYRQHSQNVTGGLQKTFFEEVRAARGLDRANWYREEIERLILLQERLERVSADNSARERISQKLSHLKTRLSLPRPRVLRLPKIVSEVLMGRYSAYSRNWGSIAIDMLIK